MSTCHTSVEIPEVKIIENIETSYAMFLSLIEGVKNVIDDCGEKPRYEYLMEVARLCTAFPHAHAYEAKVKTESEDRTVAHLFPGFTLGFIAAVLPGLRTYDEEMKVVAETLSRLLVDLTMADMQKRLSADLKTYTNTRGLKIMVEVLLVKFGYDALSAFPAKLQTDFSNAVDELYGGCTLDNAVKANLRSDQFAVIIKHLLPMLQELDTEEAQFICDTYNDWVELDQIFEKYRSVFLKPECNHSSGACQGVTQYYDAELDLIVEKFD